MNWPWGELGLSGPAELPVIRRAYAERLKTTRPEDNPDGFQRLHSAYQTACRMARTGGGVKTAEASDDVRNVSDGESQNWDFERLFAEGEAQERARRFRRTQELREANKARYEMWRPPPSQDPAEMALSWIAASRAVSLVDELATTGAERPLWDAFCRSALFLYVRDNPDFVFALEDLLQECPSFPEDGRRAFFRAYGLYQQSVRREYQPLYQLIAGRKQTAREDKKSRLLHLLILTLLICVALLLNVWVDYAVETDIRNGQVRDWMSEDFGADFFLTKHRSLEDWVVLLDTRTQVECRARWDGPRDVEAGRRGYVTDYTQARLSQIVSAFADTRDCSVYPRYDADASDALHADWSAYYFYFPITGAGEQITELAELLSAVREEGWYRTIPPDYELYLCWQDWSFYRYDAEEAFPGTELRRYYEQFFGADICRIALEQTGIAEADMGEGNFLLWSDSGKKRMEDRNFFHVTGTEDPPVRTLYHYFLSEDCKELFCVPTSWTRSELTLQDLYGMDRRLYDVKGFPEKLAVFHPVAEKPI